ncbi:transglutaminase domain-containing protein [Lyngbya sp. PCC 8106]|uniref:transglutaminase domain-containing protein n=1 Tax=Lyngbya sp. (strain PCC 8106) TaxID=313612 RepID=UPI0003017B2E|nr:transglutaminase domain-containing protein [Lyngbya sp. PCC 8106]
MNNLNHQVVFSSPIKILGLFKSIKIRRTQKKIFAISLALLTCFAVLSPLTSFKAFAGYSRFPDSLQRQTPTFQAQKNWPWEGTNIHPLVTRMPLAAETSIAAVAQYITQRESDPFLVVKALHDYVVTRVEYDMAAYKRKYYPPQDAQTVFRTGKAVCSGYARLMQALGEVAGIEVAYITGDYRDLTGGLSGEGHAWNGVKINGKWYLVDATWDTGYLNGSEYIKQYRTNYLLAPPDVMSMTHFPTDPAWQLLPRPLSRPEFIRQPALQPDFFAEGFRLIAPKRSNIRVQNKVAIQVENSKNRWMMAEVVPQGSRQTFLCSPPTRQTSNISCSLPGSGNHEVRLFSSRDEYGTYKYLGGFRFTT